MEAVDRRLVVGAVEMVAERTRRFQEPDAEPLAAAVRLEDERTVSKMLPGRFDEQFLAGDEDCIWRANVGLFQGGVLAGLADLEIERAATVDCAAAMPFEPSQN